MAGSAKAYNEHRMKMIVEKIHQEALVPTRAHVDDAGFDLASTEAHTFRAGERKLVGTGLKIAVPKGHVGLIRDRSGIAWKKGLIVAAGVIDSGYTGEWKILMINTTEDVTEIQKQERIAQVLIIPIAHPTIEEHESLPTESTRGEGGFGSSGT